MKPPEIPSRAEIEALVKQQYNNKKVPKACANCNHWIKEYTFCPKLNKTSPAYMTCHLHESKIDHFVNATMKFLLDDATENKKIEYLLSAGLACADMTMKIFSDIEKRVEKKREGETEKRERYLLKKDINMCEDINNAYEVIAEKFHEIDEQFYTLVQPYFNRVFRKDGKYDTENDDKFNSDTGEFIILLLKYIKKCYKNDINSKSVHQHIDSLDNDQYCPLDDKDINHYNVTI